MMKKIDVSSPDDNILFKIQDTLLEQAAEEEIFLEIINGRESIWRLLISQLLLELRKENNYVHVQKKISSSS